MGRGVISASAMAGIIGSRVPEIVMPMVISTVLIVAWITVRS